MKVYYNEIEPYCVEWLKNLMTAGLIPRGDVDDRSIKDVKSGDLAGYDQCHFFAGLGGWAYALGLASWGNRPVWTGSCPCQPFSVAGAQKGFEDPRHLWPDLSRLIQERRPPVFFGEQVANSAAWFRLVRCDLEEMGYAVGAMPIQAASCDADHFRDRLWFVADHDSQLAGEGLQRSGKQCGTSSYTRDHGESVANGHSERPQIEIGQSSDPRSKREATPGDRVCNVEHGSIGRPLSSTYSGVHSEQKSTRSWNGEPQRPNLSHGSLGNGAGERGNWGENTPEQAGLYGTKITSINGLYYIECPDGKWRRLPPPRVRWLGTGISARIPKLRAIGNAIDPRPASAFIKAYMACE